MRSGGAVDGQWRVGRYFRRCAGGRSRGLLRLIGAAGLERHTLTVHKTTHDVRFKHCLLIASIVAFFWPIRLSPDPLCVVRYSCELPVHPNAL